MTVPEDKKRQDNRLHQYYADGDLAEIMYIVQCY